ncbi:MAG: hypothetical protein QOH39_3374 [Verrucomicrobiota bacterium]|jgi:hypothetical protein
MVGLVSEDYFSELVARSNPTPTMVSDIQKLHQTIRGLFDETNYETFLQGSYRNDTATKKINDVDIVVLRKSVVSTVFSTERYSTVIPWQDIRGEIREILSAHRPYQGRVRPDNKCFKLSVGYEVDIVPAVRVASRWDNDPIAIWDASTGEISTSPRTHSDNCERKNQETEEAFKPVVRLFKWWARRNVPKGGAPSFYLESLLYNFSDQLFTGSYGGDFVNIAKAILDNLRPSVVVANTQITTPGENKPLFSQTEWCDANYTTFYGHLLQSYQLMRRASSATSMQQAIVFWKDILGPEFPSSV